MKQKQTKTIENHVWEPLKKHELTLEEETAYLQAREVGIEGAMGMAGVLQHIGSNEYLPVCSLKAKERNIQPFNDYIGALKYYGLDVDRGDAEYGFKMPLSENGQSKRELIIFRRRKGKK